jgi:hypothetical protein
VRVQKIGSRGVAGLSGRQMDVVNGYLAEGQGLPPEGPLRSIYQGVGAAADGQGDMLADWWRSLLPEYRLRAGGDETA